MIISKQQALNAAMQNQKKDTEINLDFLQALGVARELAEEKAKIYKAAARWLDSGVMPENVEIRRDARKYEAFLAISEKLTELQQKIKQGHLA